MKLQGQFDSSPMVEQWYLNHMSLVNYDGRDKNQGWENKEKKHEERLVSWVQNLFEVQTIASALSPAFLRETVLEVALAKGGPRYEVNRMNSLLFVAG